MHDAELEPVISAGVRKPFGVDGIGDILGIDYHTSRISLRKLPPSILSILALEWPRP